MPPPAEIDRAADPRKSASVLLKKGMASPSVVFVTTIAGWGGSEELWSRAAIDLAARGFPVSASVIEGSPLHPRLRALEARGVELWPRPLWYSLRKHPWRRLASSFKHPAAVALERLIAARSPALVVFSTGSPFPPVELLELCAREGVPFVTIAQCNFDDAWPPDDIAERYRSVLPAAQRCFFVSQGNLRLAENQIGAAIANAEIVWNPVNVPLDVSRPWPPSGRDGALLLACVRRLYPHQKGQDLLLEALAGPLWKGRPWRLSLYGEGPMRHGIDRLARQTRAFRPGRHSPDFAVVEDIWAENHVLVMPSRFEGLPLAIVEAMLCARPVVATDVAGHAEVVEDGVTGFLADAPTVGAIAAALERFWVRREDAEEIGKAGARRICEIMPPDPVRIFSDKLVRLVRTTASR